MTSSGSSERSAEDNRINWSALASLLIAALLLQISVPLIRIGASYEALDLGLSATALGVISAAYAFLPMLLAVKVGRFIDRAGATAGAPLGAGLIALCGLCLWQIPPSLASLIAFTAILGCAQIFCLASLEMLCVQSAGPSRRNDATDRPPVLLDRPGGSAAHRQRRVDRHRRAAREHADDGLVPDLGRAFGGDRPRRPAKRTAAAHRGGHGDFAREASSGSRACPG